MARIYLHPVTRELCLEGFHFTPDNVGGALHIEQGANVNFIDCHFDCDIYGGAFEFGGGTLTATGRPVPPMTIAGPFNGTIEEAIEKFGPKKN